MSGQQNQELHVDGPDRFVAVLWVGFFVALAAFLVLLSHPRALGRPPMWLMPALGVVAAAAASRTPLARHAEEAAVVRVVCCLATAGWVTDGYWHGTGVELTLRPLHGDITRPDFWWTWLIGAGVLGVAAVTWATPTDLGQPMLPTVGAALGIPTPGVDELGVLVARATKDRVTGATTVDVEQWDTGCGWTAHLTLPGDGSTWETLQPYQAAIASALDLPAGGGVTVEPWGGQRQVALKVLTRDAMAEALPYPGLD